MIYSFKTNRSRLSIFLMCLLTGCLLTGCLFLKPLNARADNSAPTELTEEDKQILEYYREPTDKDDFEDNKINIILKNSYSDLKSIGFDDFAIVEEITKISSITYNLTQIQRGDSKKITLQEDKYQILTLELESNDKGVVLEAIDRLQTLDSVLVAEPSYIYETESCWTPSDIYFGEQWGLNNTFGIHAEEAWEITRGSTDIKVGVMENNVDMSHPDLQGRVFIGNRYPTGGDHGSHVAGIIGAMQNNNIGVAGVAEVSMYVLSMSFLEQSLIFAEQNDIKIINASFYYTKSDTDKSPASYNSTHYAALANYDGLVVCSAGNNSLDIDESPQYPASYPLPNIISVGALTSTGAKASFSNFGSNVDIYAPGENILSTVPVDPCVAGTCDGETHFADGYHFMSGTSMAAPHVTGAAALLLSIEPNFTASELKDVILSTADSISISIRNVPQTVKKLNAYKAVSAVKTKSYFAGGDGTASNPFLIETEAQFKCIGLAYRSVYVERQGYENQIDYAFKLTKDIILTGNWEPFQYKFTGRFDGKSENGNRNILYKMKITQADSPSEYHGLFGFVAGATIQNITLSNCSITSDINTQLVGKDMVHVGILAGSVYRSVLKNVTVHNCTINCNVSYGVIGGIAGGIQESDVQGCKVTGGNFTSYNGALGGLAGLGELYEFENCTCKATLTKNNYADGDLVGPVVGNSTEKGTVVCEVTIKNDKPEESGGGGGGCIAEGTLITLADGRQVPVESLTGNEMLLVWNLQTGQYDTAPILFIDSDPAQAYKVVNLSFSDGTSVKVIYEHGFWDYDLNKYVYLNENAAQYFGHWFNKQGADESGNAISNRVQLTGVEIGLEYTTAYSPVTYGHLCYYVNGMLSMPGGIGGLFNIFEVDAKTMRYDEALMQADIEAYGLFTYEEFAELVPVSETVFEAFNGQYLKVAIGKGLIDVQTLESLVARYAEFLGAI